MTELAPGLLIAAPPLGDPNFDRSVVLLAAHGPEGAFGWIVNGPEVMTFADLLVRAEVAEHPPEVDGVVRIGGPVATEQIWLLYRASDRFPDIDNQFEVDEGIMACASREALERIAAGTPVPSGLVALAGYAGWAPSQLEDEIRQGAWLPTDADPSLLFDTPPDQRWKRGYERIGTSPMAFTTRTIGSA